MTGQPLDFPVSFPREAYEVGVRSSGDIHGVVLTKPHVVELILDLAGYRDDRDLTKLRLLEPCCGEGVFAAAAAKRLIRASQTHGVSPSDLKNSIVAIDIEPGHVDSTKHAVIEALQSCGVPRKQGKCLANEWVREGDFLLTSELDPFDVVVGNPPYIRIEQLSPALLSEYRKRFQTLYDRADLYIAFIERGLQLLRRMGRLAFICADRWIANKYGRELRKLITRHYAVETYVNLNQASPFETEVSAYPSIFLLRRCPQDHVESVPVLSLKTAEATECKIAHSTLFEGVPPPEASGVTRSDYSTWFKGNEPWILSSPDHLKLLRQLEERFPRIEETARVGIGVATGCDRVFIVSSDADVEPDRLVPLVKRADIESGNLVDRRTSVINTFTPEGSVIDLQAYPRLAAHFEQHSELLKRRHVARKNTAKWFRTIDRVYPELVAQPKLLIPDIAGANEITFDPGHFHPHHNLYFIVSTAWNLEVLGALLSSRVALFFVWSYAVKMRGGYLRFQAQYLRRICVPLPDEIPPKLRRSLVRAFRARNFKKIDDLSLEAYRMQALPEFDFVDSRS